MNGEFLSLGTEDLDLILSLETETKDKEIERLRSIIKEVRERLMKANIYRNYDDEEDDTHYTDLNIEEVLEILDKVSI
jgi:hypothetical protein